MLTHYQSSKGPLEIATMPLSYAKNARNKLQRTEPERIAEIEAIDAHVQRLEAEAIVKSAKAPADAPAATIGDNGGPPLEDPAPALSGREAIDAHVADLIAEAANWADGVAIESQGQADSVSHLRRMLQQAERLVNDAAAEEKRPHNDAVAEIGAWQNGYTAKGLKKTPDGSITKNLALLGRLDTAWLLKLDEERRVREAEAAQAAAAAAAEALAAREEAKETTDIAVVDAAEDKLAEAKALLKQAEGVAKERVHTGGGEGFRASSLRSFWLAQPTGAKDAWKEALFHYLGNESFAAELRELIQRYASRDASVEATRVRGIPGFHIVEDKRAA